MVEGYFATQAVHNLIQGKNVDMPICDAMYRILVERAPLDEVIATLLQRATRAEHDAYEAGELWQ